MCSWKSVFKECNSELQELLNLSCLTAGLCKEGLLTIREQQELAKEDAVPLKQNSHFIQTILPSKGDTSFEKFLNALKNEKEHLGHKELYKKLTKTHARTRARSLAPESENDSEYVSITKQQLQLLMGDVVREEMKKHDEQEQNRHNIVVDLIKTLIKQVKQLGTNGEVDVDEDQRKTSVISNTTSITISSAGGYSADYEGSDTLSVPDSGDYSNITEDAKPNIQDLPSPDDEQLFSEGIIGSRPRAKSFTSSHMKREHRGASRYYSSINVNNSHSELLKPPSNLRIPQEQGHRRYNSLPRRANSCRVKGSQSSQKLGTSSLVNESLTSSPCKTPQEENGSSEKLPTEIAVVRFSTSIDPAGKTNHDHEAVDPLVSDTVTTGRHSVVTLNIQNATDDDDDDDGNMKEKLDTSHTTHDKILSDVNHEIINPPSSTQCDESNISALPVQSISPLNKEHASDVVCPDLALKKEPILITCQFTIGDHTKQQQLYCQEKDGIVYFISRMEKQAKSRKVSKHGTQHDVVVTYNPSTHFMSAQQDICCRANMTYAFGILNFKNRIVLVAGDNPKFLDGSVYLYQLVEYKKCRYKWSEMAKSVRSCSPVVASPTHAVCTTTDDCLLVCQLSNNSDSTLKALSINIYNEACTEEGTKWKVVSLNIPNTLLNKVGHLTSGTVHQENLYLSIKTGEQFGVIQVNIVDQLEVSSSPAANAFTFHTVAGECSLTQYFLIGSSQLLSSSINQHDLSCSIGSVMIANSLVKQSNSIEHPIPDKNTQLHSVISVPNCSMLILVYYSQRLQSYILNSVSSV